MFKDAKEGQTHHDKDACYKCKICGDHFYLENQAIKCNHDLSIAESVLNWGRYGSGPAHNVQSKEFEELDKFIENLPSRVGETPKDALKQFISQHFTPKSGVREKLEKAIETFENRHSGCIGTDAEYSDVETFQMVSNVEKSNYKKFRKVLKNLLKDLDL